MSSRCHSHYSKTIRNSMRYYLNPFQHERETQWELEKQYGPEHDPEKPPAVEHGDKYIMIASTTGMILGGIIAGIVSIAVNWHFIAVVLSIIGGIVIGGILGVFIGRRIKKKFLRQELELKYKRK
jgi:hypothetical protein